jgi:FkbM family methyltransferase
VTDLYRIQALRRLALPLLARFGDRDITMRHAWHPEHRVRLNLYRHKGYWFHGKKREIELMGSLQRLLRPGDSVVEVGCHIGWISLHILKLLTEGGKLFAFEPSPKNLPYLEANLANFSNVEIVRAAVSNLAGEADFFIEPLTGQNDTLVQAYSVFEDNKSQAYSDATYEKVKVTTLTLDDYFSDESRPFSGQGHWPDGVFDGVGIDLDAAVGEEDQKAVPVIGDVGQLFTDAGRWHAKPSHGVEHLQFSSGNCHSGLCESGDKRDEALI